MIEAADTEDPDDFVWVDGKGGPEPNTFVCSNMESKEGFPCKILPWAFTEPNNGVEACISMLRGSHTYALVDLNCAFHRSVMSRFRLEAPETEMGASHSQELT